MPSMEVEEGVTLNTGWDGATPPRHKTVSKHQTQGDPRGRNTSFQTPSVFLGGKWIYLGYLGPTMVTLLQTPTPTEASWFSSCAIHLQYQFADLQSILYHSLSARARPAWWRAHALAAHVARCDGISFGELIMRHSQKLNWISCTTCPTQVISYKL